MNSFPNIIIVVLNFNGRKTINRTLASIFQTNYPRFSVTVVDNASSDGSLEEVKQSFSQVHVIRNSENVGFARGINVGIRSALDRGADFVWLINPDAEPRPDTLQALVHLASRNPRSGIISPLVRASSGKIWYAGGEMDYFRFRARHVRPRSLSRAFETEFVSGCAPLVSAEVFRRIGLFDERFFLYYEDADFSLRAKKAGFHPTVYPLVEVSHSEESRYAPEKTYWLVRSGLFFFRKHFPFFLKPFFWMVFLVRMGVVLFRIRFGRFSGIRLQNLTCTENALRDFWRYGY